MLRVANYYESRLGRNDGNPLYLQLALKRMQDKGLLEVDHLAPTGDLKPFGKYDINFWVDWGEDALTGILPYDPVYPPARPIVYWASDTHLGYNHRLKVAKRSDLVFVAQSEAVDRMKNDGVEAPVYWLPHAVEPRAYCDGSDTTGTRFYNFAQKKYDVCFVGHVNMVNRIKALDTLFKAFPNFYYGQRKFNDAAEKYANSKIVFNIAIKGDVNMRCFESTCAGGFLLTDDLPDLHKLFKVGEHIETYSNLDEMVEKAKFYLANDDLRETIARAGQAHTLANHTIDHRLNFMMEKIEEHLGIKTPKLFEGALS